MDSGQFDVAAETARYLSMIGGAERARSDAYFEGGYWLILWGALLSVILNAAILHFGWARRLSGWTERRTGRPWMADILFAGVYSFATAIILLPWSVYTGFFREHAYGLSTQDIGAWFGEWTIALALGAVFLALIAAGILAFVRRLPQTWWLWATGLVASVLVLAALVSPVLIAPLFNDYRPMPESALKADILSMARANGVPAENVYVVDASRQSNRISANVQGLGPTVRISLNDNLLNGGTAAEVRAVMGHELGHYVLGHGVKLIVMFTLLILLGFAFLAGAGGALVRRYGAHWGIESLGDRTVVPLAAILLSLFFLAATPVTNTIIRTNEQEADVFGLNAAREPDGFAAIAMKLSAYRKLDPGLWEERIFFDHPSGRVRTETAMRWKAENLGVPPAGADR